MPPAACQLVVSLHRHTFPSPPRCVLQEKKKAEEERQRELNALFAVAIKQPKVPAGVDPKSILCEFFRHGQCTKGFKCKFSHDLNIERKVRTGAGSVSWPGAVDSLCLGFLCLACIFRPRRPLSAGFSWLLSF